MRGDKKLIKRIIFALSFTKNQIKKIRSIYNYIRAIFFYFFKLDFL